MLRYLRWLSRSRPRARPLDDPARLLHDEAERDRPRWRRSRGPSGRRSTRSLPLEQAARLPVSSSTTSRRGSARSRATTRCRCSRTRGRRASTPGCWPSARYHRGRGDHDRTVCLIPSSAHGTNPASAVMAGFDVVVVACDDHGNVDLDDLRAKIEDHGPTARCADGHLPVDARRVRGRDHDHLRPRARGRRAGVPRRGEPQRAGRSRASGQVRRRRVAPEPAQDVLHPPRRRGARRRDRSVCAPISLRSCRTTLSCPRPGPRPGSDRSRGALGIGAASSRSRGPTCGRWDPTACGPRRRSRSSNANYIARRLAPHYPVLYTGISGLVAHECILDLRTITKQTGVSVDDVAKRLIDYGFHAPTMSFPVAGTLMVEPTESENLDELDRFCEAMIAIREEINQVASGALDRTDNPLANAPHTADEVTADEWDHSYSRAERRTPSRHCGAQVLAAGRTHRRGLGRPEPHVLLPAAQRLRVAPTSRRRTAARSRRTARPSSMT